MKRIRERLARSEFARLMLSSAAIVGLQMSGTALTFFYTLLMARIMAPPDVGIVWTIWSAVFLVSVVANLNLGNAAIRDVVHARTLGENDLASGFVAVLRRLMAILALPVVAGFVGAFALLDAATFAAYAPAIVLAGICVPIVAWERANGAIATALGKAITGRVAILFVRPFLAFLAIATLALFDVRPGPGPVLAILFGAVTAAAVLQTVMLTPTMRALRATAPRTDRWREWVLAGIALIPSRTMSDNLKNLFVFAAALALVDADVARFAIAFSLIVFLNFGIMAVEVVFDPKISAAIARDDATRRDRLLLQAGLLKVGPIALASLALVLLAGPILSLFGTAYVEAAPVVAWLVLMPLSRTLFGPSIMILQVHRRRADIMMVSLVGIGAILAAVAIGGTMFGLVGAAAGGSIAFALTQGATFAMCLWRTGVTPAPLILLAERLINRRRSSAAPPPG